MSIRTATKNDLDQIAMVEAKWSNRRASGESDKVLFMTLSGDFIVNKHEVLLEMEFPAYDLKQFRSGKKAKPKRNGG